MRVTRAAAAAAHIHVDEYADPIAIEQEIIKDQMRSDAQPDGERSALGELTPNGVKEDPQAGLEVPAPALGLKRSKSKQGKGAKMDVKEERGLDETTHDLSLIHISEPTRPY